MAKTKKHFPRDPGKVLLSEEKMILPGEVSDNRNRCINQYNNHSDFYTFTYV
jgi:hypothetical protein